MTSLSPRLARLIQLVLLHGTLALVLSSCSSNEAYKARQERRTENYRRWQERWKIRKEAQEERYQAWWDRVMH